MSVLRRLVNFPNQVSNLFWFRVRKVRYEEYPKISGRLVLGGAGQIILGKGIKINSSHRSNPVGGASRTSIHVAPGATISIGSNVGISNTLFYAWESITIEDDVMIGGGCQIYDTDFHSIGYEDRVHRGDTNVKTCPVIIKKGAFIGTNSIILKGVTVGERSVIAAGSVVSKDIPADEIWGGNPCRFIRCL